MLKFINGGIMRIILLFLILVLASCGNKPENDNIDPTFQPYIDHFTRLYGKSVALDMQFVDDYGKDKFTVGQCTLFPKFKAYVTIKRSYWDRTSTPGKHQLVFHELGHCLLGYGHRNELMANPIGSPFAESPKSIMNSNTLNSEFYANNIEEYLREFGDPSYNPIFKWTYEDLFPYHEL